MASVPTLRVTYQRYADLHTDLAQMTHGGLLVRIADVADLALEAPVTLELVFPDGTSRQADAKVLQVLTGHGVAVTVTPEIVAAVRSASGKDTGTAPPYHERL